MTLPFLPFQPFQRLRKPVNGTAPTFGERCRSNRCLRKASTAGWTGSAHRLFAGFRRLSRKRSNDGSFHRLSTDRSNTWNRRQFSQAFESFPETPETVPALGTGFDRLSRWLERQRSQAFTGFPESVPTAGAAALTGFPETGPPVEAAVFTDFRKLSRDRSNVWNGSFTPFHWLSEPFRRLSRSPSNGWNGSVHRLPQAFAGFRRPSRKHSNDWNSSVRRLSRDGPNGWIRSFHRV